MLIKNSRVGLLVLVAWLQAALLACSAGDSSPPKPEQKPGFSSFELIQAGDPTTVTTGSPSPRQPTCPGHRLPDLCGSWAGVELVASSGYKKLPPRGKPPYIAVPPEEAEHCLCQPIEFEVPPVLPVTEGDAGNGKAELKFRKQSGGYATCRYRGSDHGHPHGDGREYRLDRCEDGLRAGSKVTADWFELELESADSIFEKTSVALRLGEPDVVDGVVQDTVYYPDDDALLGASLTVPRGAAPAFQDFELTRLSQFPTATTLANAGTPFTTLGPAVDVQAVGQDTFAFTEVPGASCPRVELPYSKQALENLLGADAEARLQGRQITDIAAALGGAAALAPVGPITVDTLRKTVSFCTTHLSFYVLGNDQASWNANLVTARLDVTNPTATSATLDGRNLLNTPTLPSLLVGSVHTLTLEFQNTSSNGTSWSEGTAPRLVSVGSWASGAPSNAVSAWFPNASGTPTQFSLSTWDNSNVLLGLPGSTVDPGERARFHFQITAPSNGTLLNLCLLSGTNHFGTCFSWYPSDAMQQDGSTIIAGQLTRSCYNGPSGTRGVGRCKDGQQTSLAGGLWPPATSCPGQVLPTAETCNGINDDCDDETDENVKNACGGCTPLPNYGQECPFTDGTCTVTGHQACDGLNATKCDGTITRNPCGGCAALPNYGQDCPVSDGTCTATGSYQCDGAEATTCKGTVTRNACQGCGTLPQTIGGDCSNTCQGHWQCDGTEGVMCDAVLPPNYGGQCGCGGIGIMGCNGCSAPECRRVTLRMNNVDDEAYAWIGPPQWETSIFGALTPVGYVCHAKRSTNLGNLDCDITDAVLSSFAGDYRAVPITIKLVNSGCFATEGRFRLEVVETDGTVVDYALSEQSYQPTVHCGWVHRQYFEFNMVDGGAPSWPGTYPYCYPIPGNTTVHDVDCGNPAACEFDGDCYL